MLTNKTVLITGASSGFGEACAILFAREKCRLILCARREEKLHQLAERLKKDNNSEILVRKLDVRNRKEVETFVGELPESWKNIDILVNNAGLASGLDKVQEGDIDDWEKMIDTNIKGLLYLTRAIVPLMIERGIKGHVINIGSIAGIYAYPKGAVYCGTKAAVRIISDGLRMDLVENEIKVTNIQPGLAETEFSIVRFHGDIGKAKAVYQGLEPLTAMDVAETVVFAANRPPHVQICEITLTPRCQASATIVYRK
ncbi:MAG TPA: SDR family oxidoreductase [Bacteroidia bacterium]|nr:SDR family oxidoreductase [Sphingobacteriales bacterium]HPD64061.1 SDR family oxidoreductase [Bacteroidia bacterium]HRS57801.1 SDR family oxidoreductase [Bacteroidia bacterium]HRU67899.1 SDR family oxidoreductase [Bacteroidia bacterium]